MLDFLLITIVFLLITVWIQMKPFFWKNAGIVYSIPLPIFGCTMSTLFKPFYKAWTDMYFKMGDNPLCGIHFFGSPALILRDPNLIKKFTVTDAECFMARGFPSGESYDPISKGIFFSEGEQWKVFRGKMTSYFTPSRIKVMLPMIEPIAENFAHHMAKEGKSGPVDVQALSLKYSVDVIMTTVFGLKPDAFENPNSFFYNLQRELVSFVFGLKVMIGIMNLSLFESLRLTVFSTKTTKMMMRFVNDIIDQRLKGIGKRQDFVQGMVDLMLKEEITEDSGKTERYADGTIVAKFDRFSVTGQCMLMYAAGTETTGNTMSFLFYELALNPDIQEKAREEVVDMLRRTGGEIKYENLIELRYVHLIMKETLRKHPSIVFLLRRSTRRMTFKGMELPVGTKVILCPMGLHHDPIHFPDPEKFTPERFSDESNIKQGTYIPFGIGPRSCIAMKFSEMEMALAISKFLPKYKVTVSNKTEIPVKYSDTPTLTPKNGIWLNVEEIIQVN